MGTWWAVSGDELLAHTKAVSDDHARQLFTKRLVIDIGQGYETSAAWVNGGRRVCRPDVFKRELLENAGNTGNKI